MKTIFSTLKTCLETEDAVLVTVVAGSGSTPRGGTGNSPADPRVVKK